MTTISNKTMSKMRKQSKKITNSLVKESNEMRKQSMNNSKALIELNRKTKKKPVKNNVAVEKQEVQEVKVHPSFLALFWISVTLTFIATLLGF